MAVFRGSRYEGQDVTKVLDSAGVSRSFIHPRTPLNLEDIGQEFSTYLTTPSDELDALAARFAGDSTKWWVIADVNGLFCALDLKPGTRLVIPSRDFFARI